MNMLSMVVAHLMIQASTLSTAAWLWSELPVKVIAVSTSVYTLIQLLKVMKVPIADNWAVFLNFVFSLAGIFVAMPKDQFFTVQTMAALIAVFVGAGGIHGIIQTVTGLRVGLEGKNSNSVPPPSSSSGAQKTVATALILVLLGGMCIGTTGCNPTQVENEINTVLTEATNVLVVADPNAPWVPQLQNAITALKQAESTWQSGGAVQDVINALNAIELITAVIPVTAAYSPLIDVLVAGIEAVLAYFVPSPAVAPPLPGPVAAAYNPHKGRVKIQHKLLRSPSNDFKATWNATAKANGLTGALIH